MAVRCAYALVLLAALFCLYAGWFGILTFGDSLPRRDLAAFATDYFFTFMAAQLTAVLLLTPVYTSGAIAEEREAGRLDFLLTTDLSNREIVLGRFVARLGSVGLILLTGMPILGLTQFLGGVDPNLLLAGFAATLATMLSVGSFGVFVSVHCQRASSALWLTLAGIGLALVFLAFLPGVNRSHPLIVYEGLNRALRAQVDLADALPPLLSWYVGLHGVGALLLLVSAVRSLRPIVVAHAPPVEPRPLPFRPRPEPTPLMRPEVSDNPLLWKEVHLGAERRLADIQELSDFGRVLAIFLIAMTFVPVFAEKVGMVRMVSQPTVPARAAAVALAGAMLLGIGVRAAASISREREQSTLDSLLALPLERRDILWSKWLGSMASVRYWMSVLAVVWIAALLLGGLHPLAVPLLIGAFFIYAGCIAALGLHCSVNCPNRWYATLLTVTALFLWNGIPWLLPPEYWSLSPVLALWGLTVPPSETHLWILDWLTLPQPAWDGEQVFLAGTGAILAVAVGEVLWERTEKSFEAEKGPPPK